ncbi:hypothetical protein OAH12_02230, partial [Cyclobacteriaceae bacterium]|nr:hypothetical protein [Cyclobacteriaceae bacterium]
LRVKAISESDYLVGFTTALEAKDFLKNKLRQNDLCACLCGFNPRGQSCMTQQLNLCKGAGVQLESVNEYNDRVQYMLQTVSFLEPNFIIKFKGRSNDEFGVAVVKQGKFFGFGFVDQDCVQSAEDILENIKQYPDNRDVRRIVQYYLSHSKEYQTIKF